MESVREAYLRAGYEDIPFDNPNSLRVNKSAVVVKGYSGNTVPAPPRLEFLDADVLGASPYITATGANIFIEVSNVDISGTLRVPVVETSSIIASTMTVERINVVNISSYNMSTFHIEANNLTVSTATCANAPVQSNQLVNKAYVDLLHTYSRFGNVLVVDSVNGDDATGAVNGPSFLTVSAAVTASTAGSTIWILPGTYTLTSNLTIPANVSLRGLSVQTTKLQRTVSTFTFAPQDSLSIYISSTVASADNQSHDLTLQVELY